LSRIRFRSVLNQDRIAILLFYFLLGASAISFSASAGAEDVKVIKKAPPAPAAIRKKLYLIGQEYVRDYWTNTLDLVNAPDIRKSAYPGQCVTLAVVATGDDRDALLRDSSYTFTIKFGGDKRSYENIYPTRIMHIKPEGGDFVMEILKAAKVDQANEGKIRSTMSMASMATFDFGWCVPTDARNGKAKINGSTNSSTGINVRFERTSLPVTTYTTAIKQGTFKDEEELSNWIMGYYHQPNPARVLPAFRLLVNSKLAFRLNVRAFFVELLRSSPEAAHDLLRRLPDEESPVRGYAFDLLRHAGYDISPSMASLPEKERGFQKIFLTRVPPYPDIYDLRVDVKKFDTPQRMDALWSSFLATGDQKPVRAVTNLLLWRNDYKAVVAAQKTPGKKKSFTKKLGRGVCYMTAGWSLGSFVRNHGLVADYVATWKQDKKTPRVLKEELNNLLFNDAFKRR
jgi:hypothetical protein